MELNELILLAAAAVFVNKPVYTESVQHRRTEAVKEAKSLWAEVLRQEREESN
jgi:hypothetical protein